MPKYYPVLLNLEGERVLVVGGGAMAARKAATLADYGARVTVLSPEPGAEVQTLAHESRVSLQRRPFREGDLDGTRLVFAAAGDQQLHRSVKEACDRRRIPCNVVDVPELCSFTAPSILRRGELMLTISTDGLCPAYAKYWRLRLERCCFPEGAERLLHVVAAARGELKGRRELTDEEKFLLLKRLLDEGLERQLQEEGEESTRRSAIDRIRLWARNFIEAKGATQ